MKAICKGYKYLNFGDEKKGHPDLFSGQTLMKAEENEAEFVWAICSGLDDRFNMPGNLLEKMVWALLTRPGLDIVVQPVSVKTETKIPELVENLPYAASEKILKTGFLAVFKDIVKKDVINAGTPEDFIRKALKASHKTAFFSRPLSETLHIVKRPEKKSHKLKKMTILAKDKARTSLKPEIRMHLKNLLHLIRPENPFGSYPSPEPDVACKKSWETFIPDLDISVKPHGPEGRIPVLMAMHWLEVSGAERFAIELVRHLPKEKYAVHLITDVASENPWEHLIRDHVEEIFHLPDFLSKAFFRDFYVSFLKSRRIRLVHINHAPEFYRSLAHIRRFNNHVRIMDSLYIIELPPIPGGYPDFSGRFAEPFIDMHHVACLQIRDFLKQRWLVPENKMALIYLNVDTCEFDPEKIPAGNTRTRYGIPESSCLVGFIGRFVEQKRPGVFVETVAEIIKRLPRGQDNVSFIMAGSGYLDEKVREKIKALQLQDRIILTGDISELKSFYKDIDLLVMPSANEGVALVTFESMAMETPLVFADVGAQSELLPPDLLVTDSMDEKELAARFSEKCLPFILDRDKRIETGKRLRAYILENHTDKMTYEAFEKLYDRMCSGNHADQGANR